MLFVFGVVVNALLAWFESYLIDRAQSVTVCLVSSDPIPVEWIVVQGSTLSPIFFLIYINSILKLIINGKFFIFTDDSLIFLQCNEWHHLRNNALINVLILNTWLDTNLFSTFCNLSIDPDPLKICRVIQNLIS